MHTPWFSISYPRPRVTTQARTKPVSYPQPARDATFNNRCTRSGCARRRRHSCRTAKIRQAVSAGPPEAVFTRPRLLRVDDHASGPKHQHQQQPGRQQPRSHDPPFPKKRSNHTQSPAQ